MSEFRTAIGLRRLGISHLLLPVNVINTVTLDPRTKVMSILFGKAFVVDPRITIHGEANEFDQPVPRIAFPEHRTSYLDDSHAATPSRT